MKTITRFGIVAATWILSCGFHRCAAAEPISITGELKQWHKITLTFDGPFAGSRLKADGLLRRAAGFHHRALPVNASANHHNIAGANTRRRLGDGLPRVLRGAGTVVARLGMALSHFKTRRPNRCNQNQNHNKPQRTAPH
jgi:hypothetical protein